MLLIGIPDGVFVMLVASIAGIILGTAAVYLDAPKGFLIVMTALAGSTTAIAGFLVMFGQLPISILGSGLMSTIIVNSFGWTLVWIALAVLGAMTQLRLTDIMDINIGDNSNDFMYTGVKGGRATSNKKKKSS
jgi:hypothetical protein